MAKHSNFAVCRLTEGDPEVMETFADLSEAQHALTTLRAAPETGNPANFVVAPMEGKRNCYPVFPPGADLRARP